MEIEKKEIISAKFERTFEGNFIVFKRDPRFEKVLEGLNIEDRKYGDVDFKFYALYDGSGSSGVLETEFRNFFGRFTNKIPPVAKYPLVYDGNSNFGLFRLKTDGNEVKIPCGIISNENGKAWVKQFIDFHRDFFINYLKKTVIEQSLIVREVVA